MFCQTGSHLDGEGAPERRVEQVGRSGVSGKPGIGSYLAETALAVGQSSALLYPSFSLSCTQKSQISENK